MKKFKWLRAIKKGLVAAAAVAAGLVAGGEMLGELAVNQEITVVTGASAVALAVRVFLNRWKVNRNLADKTYQR